MVVEEEGSAAAAAAEAAAEAEAAIDEDMALKGSTMTKSPGEKTSYCWPQRAGLIKDPGASQMEVPPTPSSSIFKEALPQVENASY